MTVINGLPISSELIEALKNWCPVREHDETRLLSYIEYLSSIQDFLCRHMDELPTDCKNEIGEYLGSLVTIKDEFKKVEKLLPIIKKGEES